MGPLFSYCRAGRPIILVVVCLTQVMIMASCQKEEEGISEEVAYVRGLESWVYGYPIVLMDVTRQVLTAAPAPTSFIS